VLRDGIDIDYSDGGLTADVGEFDPDRTEIAEFVEYGTSSMPARPFMVPAAMRQVTEFPEAVADELRRELA
jgi:HK97 gp10 family phage protein